MTVFPLTTRDRWLFLLFPFKAYVFVAPVCFVVWDLATSEHRFRGSRVDAEAIVGTGYMVCFLAFVIAGLLFCIIRKIDSLIGAVLFAGLSFSFPIFIFENAGMLVATLSVSLLLVTFARNRQLLTQPIQQYAEAIQCPLCGTTIPGNDQKCPHCTWTYLA